MMWVGSAAGPDNWVAMGATAQTALAIVGAITAGTTITATGDIAAAGGFRQSIGPWTVTLAGSQTALGMIYGAVATVTAGWIAPTPGSLMSISGFLDAAVTGAGTNATFGVYKNGTIMNALTVLPFTQAGGLAVNQVTFAKDTYTFAAGDNITVKYTSTAISNTPKAGVNIGVEC